LEYFFKFRNKHYSTSIFTYVTLDIDYKNTTTWLRWETILDVLRLKDLYQSYKEKATVSWIPVLGTKKEN
jgi:hypothetical protein